MYNYDKRFGKMQDKLKNQIMGRSAMLCRKVVIPFKVLHTFQAPALFYWRD